MTNIAAILGDEADKLLNYKCKGVSKNELHLPGRTLSIE
jgi:class I fructose-bisphosphate aldolase